MFVRACVRACVGVCVCVRARARCGDGGGAEREREREREEFELNSTELFFTSSVVRFSQTSLRERERRESEI